MRLPILPGYVLIECQADDRFQHSQGDGKLLLRGVAHDLVLQSPQDLYLLGSIPRVSDLCYPGQLSHVRKVADAGREYLNNEAGSGAVELLDATQ